MARRENDMDDEAGETIYDEGGRRDLVADDEMTPSEEGFMQGYEDSEDEVDEVDAEPEEEDE